MVMCVKLAPYLLIGLFFGLEGEAHPKEIHFPSISPPLVGEQRVFTGSKFGLLYCFDKESGKGIWKFDSGFLGLWRRSFVCSPTIYKESVYITDVTGTIYNVSQAKGSLVWKANIREKIPSLHDASLFFNNQIVDGLLIMAFFSGICTYDFEAQKLIWQAAYQSQFVSSPIIDDAMVLYSIYNSSAKEGGIIWYGTRTGTELGRVNFRSVGLPTISNDKFGIWIVNYKAWHWGEYYEGDVLYYEKKSDLKVKVENVITSIYYNPVISQGVIIFPSYFRSGSQGETTIIKALDMMRKVVIWEYKTSGFVYPRFAVWEGNLIVGDSYGNVYCLDISNKGTLLWKYKADDGLYSDIIVDGGFGYFKAGGYLYRLGLRDGILAWRAAVKK